MTTYLADACALIVYLSEPAPARIMSSRAVETLKSGEVVVSPITVWEITRKIAIGKLTPWGRDGVVAVLRAHGFTLQPLAWEDAEHANTLPPLHKDPMDRMLIAQALRADMTIITDDAVFARYGVKILW